MTDFRRIILLLCSLLLLFAAFSAFCEQSGPTATPVPVIIDENLSEPPDAVQNMISVAHAEWEKLKGKALARSNKYTKWVNNSEWGWCAGFTSWCAMKAGMPRAVLSEVLRMPEGESEPVFTCIAVSPAKQLRAFQHMHRTTMIPRKGFFVIYGDGDNRTVHIGLVSDVYRLENGTYRITTIEGNMKNTVRMYTADYTPVNVCNEPQKPSGRNLTRVPENEQNESESASRSWQLRVSDRDGSDWYITCFLMTWIPEESITVLDEEELP